MRSLETTEHISDYCDMSEPWAFRRRLAGALLFGLDLRGRPLRAELDIGLDLDGDCF
jgi:hypothetical protein